MSKNLLYAKCVKDGGNWNANLYSKENNEGEPVLDVLSALMPGRLIHIIEEYEDINKRDLIEIRFLY